MGDSVSVRKTIPDDSSAVQRVARTSWHAAYDEVLGESRVKEIVDSWFDPENVVADVNRDERPFFVAERDSEVVGFVIGIPDEERDATFHLYRIYVHPDFWGEGIGTQLLRRFEDEVRNRAARRMRLSVIEPNEDAIAFYESRGFERVGEQMDERLDLLRYVYAKQFD
ncbi:N-acetyltransferase family protein [Haladaptatus sp. NG-SE-30]